METFDISGRAFGKYNYICLQLLKKLQLKKDCAVATLNSDQFNTEFKKNTGLDIILKIRPDSKNVYDVFLINNK